jgi:serine/threonine-protein kinase HipA
LDFSVTRRARVLFKDRPAGVLAETAGGGTRFTYAPVWQEPIACCFPVARREHEWAAGLHPFFEHLAPEGWLREHQARTAHIQDQDDFGLLLRYGVDCIGAVGVNPHEADEPPPEITEATANPGRTLSGVQKKLLVTRRQDGTFAPAGRTGDAPYIAKFNTEVHPDLVRNEHLSLRWAAAVLGRGEVNSFQFNHVAVIDEPALILTRFDRTPEQAKLRLEDFAQILGKPRGRDYSGKYDASYEDVARVIAEHSSRPEIDRLRFFRRLIAFALVGNCDAHLKNFSLLETPTGLRLSPAYDIVNTALYQHYDLAFALSIGGEKRQLETLDRARFESFGRDIGLPDRAITDVFANLRRTVARARPEITPPPAEAPDGSTHRYAEIVNNACLRILEP